MAAGGLRTIIVFGALVLVAATPCAAGGFASTLPDPASLHPVDAPRGDEADREGSRRSWRVLLAVHGASVMADLVTTQRALDRGAFERNPLLDWAGDENAVKVRALAGIGMTFSLDHLHRKSPRLARGIAWAAIILNVGVAAHNAQQAR